MSLGREIKLYSRSSNTGKYVLSEFWKSALRLAVKHSHLAIGQWFQWM